MASATKENMKTNVWEETFSELLRKADEPAKPIMHIGIPVKPQVALNPTTGRMDAITVAMSALAANKSTIVVAQMSKADALAYAEVIREVAETIQGA